MNKEHNTSVCVDDIDDWNIHQFFPELTRYQVFEPLFCGEFWDTVKPKKDAVYYVRKLKEDGFQIFICTNTNYKTLKEKMECVLFKHFDFLSWNDVIVTTNKQIIDADILVDDAVHNLIGGKYKGILFERFCKRGGMRMIVLYSTGCPKCKVLKEKLKSSNIQYVEITDVDTIVKNGIDTVPVLDVDGIRMGFSAANEWIKSRRN